MIDLISEKFYKFYSLYIGFLMNNIPYTAYEQPLYMYVLTEQR